MQNCITNIETKTNNVLGISSAGSKKCKDMLDKVHMIQKNNDGKGIVFATGIPITNSITDAYVMQKYLQYGELKLLDLQSFDSWIGMFAERVTEFEIDVDTSQYRLATRFAKFHNLPELTALLSSVADFHEVDKSVGIPDVPKNTSAMYALTSAMVYYARKHKYDMPRIANSIKYADRMPPAFLDELSDSELDFVMMHEILHVVLQLPENMNTQAITLKNTEIEI